MPKGDVEKLCLKSVKIEDFYDELPSKDFTLKEWADFCIRNPQYLTSNNTTHTVNQISSAISRGLDNIRDVAAPLELLKSKFSRATLIQEQKKQFKSIYTKCLGAPDFTYSFTDEKNKQQTYCLILDLLMYDSDGYKICVPDKLVGVLLAYTHLLGHLGTGKMLKNLESYYFDRRYTVVKSFASKCYACFLMHGSSRKSKMGIYPVPEFPMEELSMDLIENLNKSGGCQHILVVKDALTDFVLLFPLKSKTSAEVARVCKYGLLQHYNIKRLHTDNGPCFRHAEFLALMAELKIEVINTSAHKPTARGFIEREVQVVKTIFRKILATSSSKTLNWEDLPLIVSTILNHTVSTRTGFKPAQLLYGETKMSQCFLDTEELIPAHHSVRNNKTQLLKTSSNITRITEIAKETIEANREQKYESLNENRINKLFNKDDIVFVIDRTYVPGAPRPLRTRFSPSPCVVKKVFYTTFLIQRLSDGFKSLISMDEVKKYQGSDPEFNTLPQRIKNILIHDFKDFLPHDFNEILRHDPMEIPLGIELNHNQPMEIDQNNADDNEEQQTLDTEKEVKKRIGSGRQGKHRQKVEPQELDKLEQKKEEPVLVQKIDEKVPQIEGAAGTSTEKTWGKIGKDSDTSSEDEDTDILKKHVRFK
jgi:transposase InsO family protein